MAQVAVTPRQALAETARLARDGDLPRALKVALAGIDAANQEPAALPELLFLAGELALRLAAWPLAETLFDRLSVLRPREPDVFTNRGGARERQGKPVEAKADFETAFKLDPTRASHAANLARALLVAGDPVTACTLAARAVVMDAGYVSAWVVLGDAERAKGRNREALMAWRRAVGLDPARVTVWKNIARIEAAAGHMAEAVEAFTQALASEPTDEAARQGLADLLHLLGDVDGARALLEGPEPKARLKRAFMLPTVGADGPSYDGAYDRLESELAVLEKDSADLSEGLWEAPSDPLQDGRVTLFRLAYHGRNDRALAERAGALMRNLFPALTFTAPHCRDAKAPKGRRIKVGFISTFFHNHSIGKLNRAYIRDMDRRRFEVTLYRFQPVTGGFALTMDEAADRVTVLPESDLAQAQAAIAADELDALIYTDIGMSTATWHLAQARLAPLQAVTIGHPVTSGLPSLDVFLSSDLYEEPGSESQYSERLVRFSHANFSYDRPPVTGPAARADFGLDKAATVYLCPQTLVKLTPAFDPLLKGILEGDPKAQVVLVTDTLGGAWAERLQARLETSLGSQAKRVRFVPRQSGEAYFALLAMADVNLDVPSFSGGNTSLESLSLGVPVVTQRGAFLRGNVTAGLYRSLGWESCVARNDADYLRIALDLGLDATARAAAKATVKRLAPGLFHRSEPVRELESFLESELAARLNP
ncbi:MAG: tetratricopeptide repeat protein [Rhodospirillales bacterium]